MELPLQSFSSINRYDTRPLIHRKTPTKRFEMNWILFRPNSDTLRGIFELPGQNQNKSLHKTDCCNVIVARKSVAPSSDDFWRRPTPRYACEHDQEFLRFFCCKVIITPLPRPQQDLRKCVTSMIFQELLFFLLGGPGWGVPNWTSHSDFFVFKKSFFF